MTHFGELLKEDRTCTGLTQKDLAEKVDISNTYVCKLENGTLQPPSREVAQRLADALGMCNRPVTLYVSQEDEDALKRFVFLLQANVAGAEDVQEIRLREVEEGDAEEEEDQAIPTALPALAHPALALSNLVLEGAFEQIEAIFESKQFSKEQMRRATSELIESAKQIARLVKPQPKK